MPDNFIDVFANNDFLICTIHSAIVFFPATGLVLLLGVPAGYGIAKATASGADGSKMILKRFPTPVD